MATFPINIAKFLAEAGDPAAILGSGQVYTKLVAGVVQLFYEDSSGVVYQLTPNGSMILFGASSVAASTASRALWPAYENATGPLIASVVQFRVPRAGTIKSMRVHANGAGNGNAIVYTLRVNGVASVLTVSMLSTAVDGSDLVNTVAVAAGDLLDVNVTKALAVGTSPSDITCTVEYV